MSEEDFKIYKLGLTAYSEEDVIEIRTLMANNLIKPILKSRGFDVDIDVTDGITIIDKEKEN